MKTIVVLIGVFISLSVLGSAVYTQHTLCNDKSYTTENCNPIFGEDANPNTAFWLALFLNSSSLAALTFLGIVAIKRKSYFWFRNLIDSVLECEITPDSTSSKLRTGLKLLGWYFVLSLVITVPITSVLVTYSHEEVLGLLPETFVPSIVKNNNWCGTDEKSSNCIFEYAGLNSFVVLGTGSIFTYVIRRFDKDKDKGISKETKKKIEKAMIALSVLFFASLFYILPQDRIILYDDDIGTDVIAYFGFLIIFIFLASLIVFSMERLERYLSSKDEKIPNGGHH